MEVYENKVTFTIDFGDRYGKVHLQYSEMVDLSQKLKLTLTEYLSDNDLVK